MKHEDYKIDTIIAHFPSKGTEFYYIESINDDEELIGFNMYVNGKLTHEDFHEAVYADVDVTDNKLLLLLYGIE